MRSRRFAARPRSGQTHRPIRTARLRALAPRHPQAADERVVPVWRRRPQRDVRARACCRAWRISVCSESSTICPRSRAAATSAAGLRRGCIDRARHGASATLRALDPAQTVATTGKIDAEPVDYLRRMCRYLAPNGGADLWTLFATLARNLRPELARRSCRSSPPRCSCRGCSTRSRTPSKVREETGLVGHGVPRRTRRRSIDLSRDHAGRIRPWRSATSRRSSPGPGRAMVAGPIPRLVPRPARRRRDRLCAVLGRVSLLSRSALG